MPVHVTVGVDSYLESVRSEVSAAAKNIFQLKTAVGKKPNSYMFFPGVNDELASKFIKTASDLNNNISVTVSGTKESLEKMFPQTPIPQEGSASGLAVVYSKNTGAVWRGSFRIPASATPLSFITEDNKFVVRGKISTTLSSGHELWKAETFLNDSLRDVSGYVAGGKEGSQEPMALGSSLSFQFSVSSNELSLVLRSLCSLPCTQDVSLSFYSEELLAHCSLLWRQTEKKSMVVTIA